MNIRHTKNGDKMKPIIGIIGIADCSINNKNIICIFENYRKAIIKYGGIPIVILPPQLIDYYEAIPKETTKLSTKEKEILINQINLCNGIIIPGGSKRFEHHNFICDYCNKKQIPILGICMGMQVMCNYNNDNKNKKIETNFHNSQKNYKHLVNIDENSKLFTILKEKQILVNSFHSYQVENSGSYKIAATCEKVIEAVEKKQDPFNIGVQWHPEKNYDKDLNSKRLFTYFINCAKLYYHE